MKRLMLMIFLLAALIYACDPEDKVTNLSGSENEVSQVTEENEILPEPPSQAQDPDTNQGKILIPNYTMVNNEPLWGFSDQEQMSSFLIEPVYTWVSAFNDNDYAIVAKDSSYGIIDVQGDLVISLGAYEEIRSFQNYFLGKSNGKTDIFLKPGEILSTYEGFNNYYVYKDQLVVSGDALWILDTHAQALVALEKSDEDLVADLSVMNYKARIQAVYDPSSGQFHYEKDGVPVSETYDIVMGFDQGLSIVGRWMTGDHAYLYTYVYGLIDENGQEVLPLENTYIHHLGDGYYAFSRLSSLSEDDLFLARYGDVAYKKGLWKDQILFEEAFFTLKYLDEGRFHVNDGSGYRFIDAGGKEIMASLDLKADYDFSRSGPLWVGRYGDNRIFFKDDVLVSDDFLFSFDQGYVTNHEASFVSYSWSYPQIEMKDETVADKINAAIVEDWHMAPSGTQDVFYETLDMDFQAYIENQRLILMTKSFYYGYGAAHGNYGEATRHYDLRTGQVLGLEDLFQDDPYELVPEMLADYDYDSQYFYEDLSNETRDYRIKYFTFPQYNFTVKDGVLEIYFNPYEIAPYAAGIVRFYFPLEDLNLVDRSGPFYK